MSRLLLQACTAALALLELLGAPAFIYWQTRVAGALGA
jgi:hypothetical protein